MLSTIPLLAATIWTLASANASPTIVKNNVDIEKRDVFSSALASLTKVTPTASPPASPVEGRNRLSSIFEAKPAPTDLFDAAGDLVREGLTSSNVEVALGFVSGVLTGANSDDNINLRQPHPPVYPTASSSDAPYDLTEAELRAAIHIPSSFKYGAKGAPQPVILTPGTGDTGYTTFVGNYIPLLQNSQIGDPVWLNIPGFLLNDVQTNAEYVAYAINYISGISNHRQVAVFGWSQGNIGAQWAFKYWPSTQSKVTDHVAFSPDYHGTIVANVIGVPHIPLPPSVLQQDYNSQFIQTLRSNGGDSAYVPTTTVYSGLGDEIVEPQQGKNASAYLLDNRGVGVTNNEVQLVCPGTLAGSFYTHEGALYNPVGYALAVDALKHNGPGRMSRLDLDSVCAGYLSPGLDVADFLLTENTILVAGLAIALYPNKVSTEPPIKGTV